MKKKLSLLLAILLLVRLFSLVAVAHNETETEATYDREQEIPIYVEQVDVINRYAVDVEYKSMTIQVESAIWDVNDHCYFVTMEGMADTDAFATGLAVINHSDKSIEAEVSVSLDNGLRLSDASKIGSATVDRVIHLAIYPEREDFLIYIVPEDGWQAYINTVITRGVPDDNISPVGTVTLTVSPTPKKSN